MHKFAIKHLASSLKQKEEKSIFEQIATIKIMLLSQFFKLKTSIIISMKLPIRTIPNIVVLKFVKWVKKPKNSKEYLSDAV